MKPDREGREHAFVGLRVEDELRAAMKPDREGREHTPDQADLMFRTRGPQ